MSGEKSLLCFCSYELFNFGTIFLIFLIFLFFIRGFNHRGYNFFFEWSFEPDVKRNLLFYSINIKINFYLSNLEMTASKSIYILNI